jgi:SAM-dependent methyltransferase
MKSLATHNEAAYSNATVYERSPHLRHRSLNGMLRTILEDAVGTVSDRGLPPTLLDVGAGRGPFVAPALKAGCRVTAVDMSPTAVASLDTTYGQCPNFKAMLDPDGTLDHAGSHSIILYASVLHHIPDYMAAVHAAITNHLEPGGILLTFQDPLLYATMPRGVHQLHAAAFAVWRVGQPGALRGLRSRLRRTAVGLQDRTEDMVEYHVVRGGVDQESLLRELEPRFESVEIRPYWATPGVWFQRFGERLGLASEFACVATGFRGET